MVNLFWILGFCKNSGLRWLKTGNKLKKNLKENSLKYQATGIGF